MAEKKKILIRELVSEGCLKTKEVIDAFMGVPREEFVPKEYRVYAYVNEPIPIKKGQTISQPLTIAVMTEALDVKKGMKVLEIGTGSGYQAAILSRIVGKTGIVISVERIGELIEFSRNNLSRCNYEIASPLRDSVIILSDNLHGNIILVEGDGSLGYAKQAPYDRIIVTASSSGIPEKLVEQLKINGKMIIPVEDEMFLITKTTESKIKKEFLGYFAFVPLIGKLGHKRY